MHAFLFTDLESSTRLWEEHPEEMKGALATHDRILAQAVGAAGGHVLKTTGDGVIAVFPSVADAIGACLDSQLGISNQTWPTSRPLKVRMGLHAGEAWSIQSSEFSKGTYSPQLLLTHPRSRRRTGRRSEEQG